MPRIFADKNPRNDSEALSRQDDAEDLFRSGCPEDAGAFFERGAGRENVIDEPDRFATECFFVGLFREAERAGEIFLSFGRMTGLGLGEGEAFPEKDGFLDRDREFWEAPLREFAREEGGLVESAEALSPRMEWDGDDEVWDRKRRMIDTLREDFPEERGELVDVFVLEDMDGFGQDPVSVGSRDEDPVEYAFFPTGETAFAARCFCFPADEAFLFEERVDAPLTGRADPGSWRVAADAGTWEEEIAEVFTDEMNHKKSSRDR